MSARTTKANGSAPRALSRDAVQRLLDETRERHGPWTAHDVLLVDGLSTGGPERSDERLRRVLTSIEDFCRKPIGELRILDLGALEGIFAIELARLGAQVVAVEAREANAARCRAAVRALGLEERVTVLEQDVRELSLAGHGRFDVVLCLGILYHLDAPDVFRFVSALGELCTGLLIVDTHIALTDAELAAIDDRAALTVDPLVWLSGSRAVHDDRGVPRRGRIFFEHSQTASESERLASAWASIQPQSFWLERETLIGLLAEAGFPALYAPVAEGPPDRVWLVAARGDRRTGTAIAKRLRDLYRPGVPADPPEPALLAHATNGSLPDIVCFAIIPWSGRWQRPQQILTRFARRGHRVFLVSCTDTIAVSGDGPRYGAEEVAERVWEIKLAISPPFMYERAPATEQVDEALHALRALAAEHGIGAGAIAMVQLAGWTPIALAARTEHDWTLVYDCMDEWDGFPHVPAWVVDAERTLIHEADAVTVTALPLWERMAPLAGNTVLVRNGGDPSHYANPGDVRPLADLPRPIIGFIGGIAPWVDVELVARAARERPDWTFALVGDHVTDLTPLHGLGNVHLEPRRPYELMPAYVREFDVCMIPFRVDAITQAVDPVKVYEYFSLGKPVVSRPIPELWRFDDLLHVALEPEDFVEAIEKALAATDLTLPERRRAVAAEADWEHRLDTMLAAVDRGRMRGYDRVRSWALGRQLSTLGPVVVAGEPSAIAEVLRLRPELFVPEQADPDLEHAGAVLALSLDPAVVERASRMAEHHGLGSLFVLTRARGQEVPAGHRDLVDAACVALQHQRLALVDVERLMWIDPDAPDHGRLKATVAERADASTRELLIRAAPAAHPATVVALQEQIRHLRHQLDALVHRG